MVAIYLAYDTAGGPKAYRQLPVIAEYATFFLPNTVSNDLITLSSERTEGYSHVCLVQLPISTLDHYKSVVLRDNDQFISESGRWAVIWDDEQGTISQSMKPPPLPLVSGDADAPSTSQEPLKEIVEKEASPHVGVVQESPRQSTCSPSPSSAVQTGRDEDPTEDGILESFHKEVPSTGEIRERVMNDVQIAVKEQTLVPENFEPTPEGQVDDVEPAPDVPAPTEPEPCPREPTTDVANLDHPQRGQVLSVEPLSSSSIELANEERDTEDAETPSPPSEPQRTKRRLQEIETPDSSLDAADIGLQSDDAEPEDTIFVSRKPGSRRTYGTRERKQGLQTPSRQPTTRKSLTRTATPDSKISTEQPSAKRRSTRSNSASSGDYLGPTPVVIFSSATEVDENKKTMKTFERLGGKKTSRMSDATVLCVPEGPLKKTSKLLMAVLFGIDIVTEEWIAQTHRLGRFPAVGEYLPSEIHAEREWETNLKDAVARGKQGLAHLLTGTTVFFTKQLRSDLGNLERDFSQIATKLGAEKVERRIPNLKDRESTVLVIGVQEDPQAAKVAQLGYTLFNKDILTMAALRGRLEQDCSDFVIEVSIKNEEEED